MAEKNIYEEYKVPPQIWGWIMLVIFGILIMAFAMWAHHGIPDPPRYWDHGQLTDTPAEGVYSTWQPAPITTTQPVVSPLPEAPPLSEHVEELGRPGPLPRGRVFREERQGQ